MALMALDHARLFVARDHPSEFWGVALPQYDGQTVPFLTRLVTHLCAPGFCFLMGVSMAMLTANRQQKQGWSRGQVARYFLLRGAMLCVLQHVVENPAWLLGNMGSAVGVEHYGVETIPGAGDNIWLHFGVLYTLGASMMLWGALMWLPSAAVGVLSVLGILASAVFLPDASLSGEPWGAALNLLLIPGRSQVLQVYYPLLPWAGVVGLGVLYGRGVQARPERAFGWAAWGGAAALAVFGVVRALGGFGNHHGLSQPGWIGWLNVTKYPPSLAYLGLTLGVVGLMLAGFALVKRRPDTNHPLMVLGQTALGFYVAHLYLYAVVGYGFAHGSSFAVLYGVWAAGLVPLYVISRRWRAFKRAKPSQSLWRMF